jgi:GDP-L-fucose synthase
MIQTNVIHGAFQAGVEQLMFLGSSCIYPRNAEQPIKENALLTGRLEKTNEPYAIAKIAGLKLCESFVRQYGVDYRCLMPANLYGPGDNYHPDNSHVIPALIARFHKAKISGEPNVAIWGSGTPKREFVYVDDLAEASVHVMEIPRGSFWSERDTMCSHVNVGSGSELSISNLAQTISSVVEYDGGIIFDESKPDGTPRKIMSNDQIRMLGWRPRVSLEDGIRLAYGCYLRSL